MGTLTSRHGLYKPDSTETVNIGQLNSNADMIDAALGLIECTSTTRPSAPGKGQLIFETNTGYLLYWTGTAWGDTTKDSGWLDFGSSFTPAANWTTITAQYRKVGRIVTVNTTLTYTGPTVTVSAQGNFTDIVMGNIATATLRPLSGFSAPMAIAQMGVTEWFGRLDASGGQFVMSHGIPSMSLTNPTNIAVRGSYTSES